MYVCLMSLQGFYSVFRDVFKTISEEDREYVTLKEGQDFIIPEFGTSNSSYEEVYIVLRFW